MIRLIVIQILLSTISFSNICDRTPGVVRGIEELLSKNCDAILLEELGSIVDLDLSYNRIQSIKRSDFGGLGNLESLDLGVNTISELSEDIFDDLQKLTELSLESNNLTRLPQNVFVKLTELEILSLSGNKIDPIPVSFFY